MSDRDVQREIEANERRARDEEDVGLEEDSLRDGDSDGTFLDNLADGLRGEDDSEQREVEHRDPTKRGSVPPE